MLEKAGLIREPLHAEMLSRPHIGLACAPCCMVRGPSASERYCRMPRLARYYVDASACAGLFTLISFRRCPRNERRC